MGDPEVDSCYVGHGDRSRADAVARRLLRIPDQVAARGTRSDPEGLFSLAMIISGLRCTLSYVILPFLLPALGLGAVAGLGPEIGIPVGVVALYFDVKGIRRFWLAGHRLRWQMTLIYLAVIGLVLYLVIVDLVQLFG